MKTVMIVRFFLIFGFLCGFLKSHESSGGAQFTDQDKVRYADIFKDHEDQHLVGILLDTPVCTHCVLNSEQRLDKANFITKIRERSDLMVDVLEIERVDFTTELSRDDYKSLSRSIMIFDFVRKRNIPNAEGILNEARTRLLSWPNDKINFPNRHTYLDSLFEILVHYGDSSDLKTLDLFNEGEDDLVKYYSEISYKRLAKKISANSDEPIKDQLLAEPPSEVSNQKKSQGLEYEASFLERFHFFVLVVFMLLIVVIFFIVIQKKSVHLRE